MGERKSLKAFAALCLFAALLQAQQGRRSRDLQGIGNAVTATPLQRPAAFAGKLTVTDAEARVWEKKGHSNDMPPGSSPAVFGRDHLKASQIVHPGHAGGIAYPRRY
jgi:hypothetical protein